MTRPLLWATAVAMVLLTPHQSMGGANFSDTFGSNNDPHSIQAVGQIRRTDDVAHASFRKSPGPMVVAAPPVPAAPAQTGVIAFMDHCTHRVYAIRADGTGRVELPLPPLPQPATAFEYGALQVLDLTTSGPTTVVCRLWIIRRDRSEPASVALYAVQVNDAGTGVLTPGPLVRLTCLTSSRSMAPLASIQTTRFGGRSHRQGLRSDSLSWQRPLRPQRWDDNHVKEEVVGRSRRRFSSW